MQAGFEVTPLTAEDGGALLLKHLHGDIQQDTTDNTAQGLAMKAAQEVGCLPLAVCQMAGFMSETETSLEEFLQLFRDRQQRKELLAIQPEAALTDYSFTVATAWDLALSSLDTESTALIRLYAMLDPDSIPEALFRMKIATESRLQRLGVVGPGLRHVKLTSIQ